jgi:hypothetical protein
VSCPDTAKREEVVSEEEAAPAVWDHWVCGLVGLDSVNWVCFCCDAVGDGKNVHCPVYIGLLEFRTSNFCSNGNEVAAHRT